MTVVVSVKVFDGVVVAADSATTLPMPNGSAQVYNNANKVFHLHRTKPVAAATWGLGAIGSSSISTFAKDLRRRLMGADPDHEDWELTDDYTIQAVAERLVDMMFGELYSPLVASGQVAPSPLGFLVAGFSGQRTESELWTVSIEDPAVRPAPLLQAGGQQFGWVSYAVQEASMRLFNGIDPNLVGDLQGIIDPAQWPDVQNAIQGYMRQPAIDAMPFADAIKLAQFLADTTIGYAHYLPGPDIVGGPVEIASISRHEGFRWIARKHYYDPGLNPKEPGHVV